MTSLEINLKNDSLCGFRFKETMEKIYLQDEVLWSSPYVYERVAR